MAAEPTAVSMPHSAVAEPPNASAPDADKQTTEGTAKLPNGNSHAKPAETSTPAEEKKLPEDTKPIDEPKPVDAKPSALEATADGQEESSKADKREHAPGDSDEPPSEPALKKQKTATEEVENKNGDAGAGTSTTTTTTTTTNGEKKKSGRPKKTKDTVKKVVPSDGIGSRTRSRTKAT